MGVYGGMSTKEAAKVSEALAKQWTKIMRGDYNVEEKPVKSLEAIVAEKNGLEWRDDNGSVGAKDI